MPTTAPRLLSHFIFPLASCFLVPLLAGQATFVADSAPVAIELSFQHERSGTCPMPRLQGPRTAAQFADPANPSKISVDLRQFFQGGDSFSCPVLRFNNAMVSFEHPSGGFSGTIADGTAPTQIALATAGVLAHATAEGTARDTDPGEGHGFVAVASGNVNGGLPTRPPLDPTCQVNDGFRSGATTSQQLSASVDCAVTAMRVVSGSVQMEGGRITSFHGELVSDAWLKADHGAGTVGSIQRGARYRVTLRSVYRFEADTDEVSALNPMPPTDFEVPPGDPTDYTVDADYQLKTQDKGELQLAAFDAGGNQIDGSAPIAVQKGSGNQRLSLTSVRPEPEAEKVTLRVLLRSLDGSILAQSAPLEWKVGEVVNVTRIQVIQVIQTEDNSVPLIAGKPGIARVFVDPVDSNLLDKLVLVGRRAGVTLPGKPLSPKSPLPDEYGALQFKLPTDGDWLKEGVTELVAGLQLDQGFSELRAFTAAFQPAAPLSIRYIRFCRDTREGCVHPAAGKLDLLLRRLYPMTPSLYRYEPVDIPPRVYKRPIIEEYRKEAGSYRVTQNGVSFLERALRRFQIILARKGLLSETDQLIGFVPSDPNEFKRLFSPPHQIPCGDSTRTVAVRSLAGVADPLSSGGAGRTMLIRAPASKSAPIGLLRTFAHEIGHNMGLAHPGPPFDPGCSENGLPGYWPYPDVKIQGFGYDSVKDQLLRPDDFVDLMSYSRPPWITPFHYDRLVEGQFQPQGKAWQTRPWRGRLEEEGPSDGRQQTQQVLVSGFLNDDGSEAGLDPLVPLPDGVPFGEFSDSSSTCLRLSGSGGGVAERCIEAPFEEYESTVGVDSTDFAVVMDAPTPLVRAELLQEGLVIATREAGEAAPEVAITSPAAGGAWDGSEQNIVWSASDADGDAMTYTVSYSSDGGNSFLPLEVDLEATEFAFDASQIAGGDNVYIEVLATDGLHSGTARVGPISIVQ